MEGLDPIPGGEKYPVDPNSPIPPGGGGSTNNPSSHIPNVAGSVITAEGVSGETLLIRIQNISSTANLGVRLDLKKIALKCRNTEFNPRRFGAVIMRLREPRCTGLLFASGKMVVTGVKSTHNATLAAKKLAYVVERVGFTPREFIDFKVQNIVGTADVGFPIRLEGLVYAHSAFASYEPELFPGLIYRLVNPRVVFLIFVSGKVVLTGAKKETDLSHALSKLYPVLLEFRKSHLTTTTMAGATGSTLTATAGGGVVTTRAIAGGGSTSTSHQSSSSHPPTFLPSVQDNDTTKQVHAVANAAATTTTENYYRYYGTGTDEISMP